MDLLSPTVFFGQKLLFKVAIMKTKSATIAFFLFSAFSSPHSFFFCFPFLRYCDFGAFLKTKNLIYTRGSGAY